MCISPLANGHHYVSYTNTMDGWSTRQVKERERERERECRSINENYLYFYTNRKRKEARKVSQCKKRMNERIHTKSCRFEIMHCYK